MASFAEVLKQLRNRAGLTQEALAEKAGLKRAAVARLELGIRTLPNWETVQRLAAALGVSTEELKTGEPPADVPDVKKPARKKGKG